MEKKRQNHSTSKIEESKAGRAQPLIFRGTYQTRRRKAQVYQTTRDAYFSQKKLPSSHHCTPTYLNPPFPYYYYRFSQLHLLPFTIIKPLDD
jgi:hypothetical protein